MAVLIHRLSEFPQISTHWSGQEGYIHSYGEKVHSACKGPKKDVYLVYRLTLQWQYSIANLRFFYSRENSLMGFGSRNADLEVCRVGNDRKPPRRTK